jgi:ribonuclease P/MRP protein subunit RPP1
MHAHTLADSAARRSLISNALSLVRMTKGRNIILSSGAEAALGLRNPYDAANLTRLFGFSLEASI